MSDTTLVAHRPGSKHITADALEGIVCPEPEGRWCPVPHHTVLSFAKQALDDAGYKVKRQQLVVSGDRAKFFGTLDLESELSTGVALSVGIRSSFDKSISLQWCCGSRVFMCDNLAFSAEYVISRKHTTNGATRYQEAICRVIKELDGYRDAEVKRINILKGTTIDTITAESTLLKLYQDEQILSPRTLPDALEQWRAPTFPGLEELNSWRLFNAVTYAIRDLAEKSPQRHSAATIRLGAILTQAS